MFLIIALRSIVSRLYAKSRARRLRQESEKWITLEMQLGDIRSERQMLQAEVERIRELIRQTTHNLEAFDESSGNVISKGHNRLDLIRVILIPNLDREEQVILSRLGARFRG